MVNKYKRVLLKLSGEALANKSSGDILDAKNLSYVANAIKAMHDRGVQIAIVVGGGNIFRGRIAETVGIERSQADYMGMLGTIINAMGVQSALINVGLDARVMTALDIPECGELFIRRNAISHLENGRIVIFGGGTGNPYFTTDTCSALRASEVGCDAILMAKNGVDGVYSDDPRVNKEAVMFKEISYNEMLARDLKVMDRTAVSLCMDSHIEIRVFNMSEPSNFVSILEGKDIGTTIKGE